MFTLQFLSESYGLTYKQVRDRLTALGPLLDGELLEGKQRAKILTERGRAIFDRLIQLERRGLAVVTAVEMIRRELKWDVDSQEVKPLSAEGPTAELIKQMQARIEEQARMIAYLQAKLDEALAKIPALPPPRRSFWERLLWR